MSQGSNSTKAMSAMFALTATLAATLAGVFVLVQSVFPWMTVMNPREAAPRTAVASVQTVDVTEGGPTPAERALRRVMGVKVPQLRGGGWSEVSPASGVPGVSFGFGCDPTDGLAPVVAESRSWVQTRSNSDTSVATATASVDVSARAYPAGGGALAFAGVTDAVARCSGATLYPASGVGVEVAQVVTSKVAALVWRRGDVIVVGTSTSGSRAGSISAYSDVFDRFDEALEEALSATCVDPVSGLEQAKRSPYVNREDFFGNSTVTTVKRDPRPRSATAEARTVHPVVKIPGQHVSLPYVVTYRPTPPDPAVTTGPTALPSPVSLPVEPQAPTARATNSTGVPRKIDDPQGPGCGWSFTGQVAPNFDAAAAQKSYRSAVKVAKSQMAKSWTQWQNAKLDYYAQYAAYVTAAQKYKKYATEVERVRQAWAVVEEARAVYYAALAEYEAAVEFLAQWKVDRAQARADYRADKEACLLADTSGGATGSGAPNANPKASPKVAPTPTATPTATPTTSPTATPTASPTAIPTATPTATPTPPQPELVCPPARPEILSQDPPEVPDVPVPSDAAQLPKPKPVDASTSR